MVIIIGDNLATGGNIGVMASKCGRITHPEALMSCLVLVCPCCLRWGSFVILCPSLGVCVPTISMTMLTIEATWLRAPGQRGQT